MARATRLHFLLSSYTIARPLLGQITKKKRRCHLLEKVHMERFDFLLIF
jgi:hypothetical protein